MKTRLTTATTSLSTLNQNIAALKSCLQPKTKFMAVIKANAYGHGALEIAKHLESTKSADYFGVACIFEVAQLRQNGIKTPILNFGALTTQDLPSVFELNFTPTIFDFETAANLSQMAQNYEENVENYDETAQNNENLAKNEDFIEKIDQNSEKDLQNDKGLLNNIHKIYQNIVNFWQKLSKIDEKTAKNTENPTKTVKNQGKTLKIHIKINTGMNRLGIDFENAPEIIAKIANLPNIEIEGIYSHLACADEPKNPFTQKQISRFENVIKILAQKNIKPKLLHLANSAGILFHKNSHFNMVRAGIAIYGYLTNNSVNFSQKNAKIQPKLPFFSKKLHLPVDLKPILQLKTQITQIREIKKGEGVSYSRTFIAKKPTKIATLPIGYADGLPRMLQKKLKVLASNKLVPIAGRICMDQTMIDISTIKNAKIGDEIIIFGKKTIDFNEKNAKIEENVATARELAIMLNTIPYEILTNLSERVERIYVK